MMVRFPHDVNLTVGLDLSDVKRPKKLPTESRPENEVTREVLAKKMVAAPPRRKLARWVQSRGLSEYPSRQ